MGTKYLNLNLDSTLGGEYSSDTTISSQKAIKTYVDTTIASTSYTANNPQLVPVEGICTWTVEHNLNTRKVICNVYQGNNIVEVNTETYSDNVVIITFNSNATVLADTYTVVVVTSGGITSSGGGSYSDFVGADGTHAGTHGLVPAPSATDNTAFLKGDGTWVTPDDSLSSTSTNPVQNNVIYPSLSNFIPRNTTINVKTDGTGDFTKLSDAITYLESKWSNGLVVLQLGTGTFTESSTVTINTGRFNIPHLQIKGTSKTDTIIKGNLTIVNSGSFIQLNDFGIEGTNSTTGNAIYAYFCTVMRVSNVAISKFERGVYGDYGVKLLVSNLTVSDINKGIDSNRGSEIAITDTYTATNVNTAINLYWGSTVRLAGASRAFTNVTTQTSIAPNSMSTAGVILGNWAS